MACSATPNAVLNDLRTEQPRFRSGLDVVALTASSVFRQCGFKCTAVGDQKTDAANSCVAPPGWDRSEDSVSFTYFDPRTNKTIVAKFIKLGPKVLANAVSLEDGVVKTVDLDEHSYVEPDVSIADPERLFRNLGGLVDKLRAELVDPFVGAPAGSRLQIPQTDEARRPAEHEPQGPPRPARDPLRADDYDPLRVPPASRRQPPPYGYDGNGNGGYGVPRPPFGIGGHDVFPSPLGGGPWPGAPSGNLIGPTHPGFGPGVQDPYASGFPFGGGPRPGHPPGARFDPWGPPGSNRPGPDPDMFPPPGPPGGFSDSYFL